jgi:CheY-like chemotaxis protein
MRGIVQAPCRHRECVARPERDKRKSVKRSLEGLRVLLVDDDADARELFALVLTDAGAEVRTAADAKEAIRAAIQWPPGVVVSDLVMPGTDGFSLLRELRSMHHLKQMPAIAVSGMASAPSREGALAVGFQEHVEKPLTPEALVEVVARWAPASGNSAP